MSDHHTSEYGFDVGTGCAKESPLSEYYRVDPSAVRVLRVELSGGECVHDLLYVELSARLVRSVGHHELLLLSGVVRIIHQ